MTRKERTEMKKVLLFYRTHKPVACVDLIYFSIGRTVPFWPSWANDFWDCATDYGQKYTWELPCFISLICSELGEVPND